MIRIETNKAKKTSVKPVLSVLIPFYNDDPGQLLSGLAENAVGHQDIEIIIYDDGSTDDSIFESLVKQAQNLDCAITLIRNPDNRGRSYARNALKEQARSAWILFLDADMLPVSPDFLHIYLKEIASGKSDILFGGFDIPGQALSPQTELHGMLAKASDCHSAKEREKCGPQYVCSSNLCVRASVLEAEPFDPDFSGWGWEDSEWAARVSKTYRLRHIDNPALHLGLESTDTLLQRFKTSAANYKRFIAKHPELATRLKLYRLSRWLGKIPGQRLLRPVYKTIAKSGKAPTRLRILALKLWRASWYAEALA